MDELLKHHIRDTERRFDEVMEEFDAMHGKIEKLHDFKVQMIVSARWVSLIISTLCGIFTFAATVAATHYMGK